MEPVETLETDANGEVSVGGTVDSADEVIMVYATVRGQTETVVVAEDETHGIQTVVFEIEESATENETNETVAVTMEAGL